LRTTAIRIAAVTLCFLLAALAFRGSMGNITKRLCPGAITSQNDAYLKNTFDRALSGFGVMSGIKAGLAIIEGSTAGVSAGATVNLQVGDVVQSVYDYVDIAWRTLLTGCIAILSIQYILKAATVLEGYILGFTLLILGISLLLRWWGENWNRTRETITDILSVSIVALIAIIYILPVSVWGASRLSQIITQPAILEAQSGFAETKETLFPDETDSADGFFARIKQVPERIQQIAFQLKEKSTKMAVWTIKLIAGYIFDCIVFPVALFVLLLWLTRSVMRYIFHKQLQTSLRNDIARLLSGQSIGKMGRR
jgi:hypothetical protein